MPKNNYIKTHRKEWNKYQNDYRKSNYKQLNIVLSPDVIDPFREKLKQDGITVTEFIRTSIEAYMKEGK